MKYSDGRIRIMSRAKRETLRYSDAGFTLIEVLVIIGIMAILMILALPVYRSFQDESDLNNSTEEIINTLRIAQNKTLASEGASQYGVYFDTSIPYQVIMFKGENYTTRDSSFDKINKLPDNIEIYEINLAGGESEVVFNRINGETSQTGNLSLRLINNPPETKTIYIESSGQIDLSSIASPSNDRLEDSRHVHFDLGWSIQNATLLKFYFPDIPQTEQVDMANFFDVGKTEFNWQGTFTIDGTDQVFQVHTHSLDALNSLLCIHRDRKQGRTNQEVIVYIVEGGVDKEIAHYLADVNDSVTEGPYGGTKEIQ